MFTALTTIILTASTALACATALAARASHPFLVIIWLAQGAVGGFCAGLGFSYLVSQLRSWSLAKSRPRLRECSCESATDGTEPLAVAVSRECSSGPEPGAMVHKGLDVTVSSKLIPYQRTEITSVEWDLVYAGADLGWTLGMLVVIVLDARNFLLSDWDYLWAAAIPLCGAGLAAVGMWRHQRCQTFCVDPGRTAAALLAGFVMGLVTVYTWVGFGQVMCWVVALVLAAHLGVSCVVLAHLFSKNRGDDCEEIPVRVLASRKVVPTIYFVMTNTLRTVLVLLRLAIGWHLLVEGYVKLHSLWTGPTETSQPFTSRYYLQQSVGPLRGFFQWAAGGDPDEVMLEKFTLVGDGERRQPSPTLRRYWEEYLENFARVFQVEGPSLVEMRDKLRDHLETWTNWLATAEVEWTKSTDWGPVQKKQKVSAWLAEYRQLLTELRELEQRERWYFARPVGRERAQRLRAELAWYRNQLATALRNRTENLLRAWHNQLPADKKATSYATVPEPNLEPTFLGRTLVWWADRTTAWGLALAGGLLLFGLLSRLAAWFGFVLILLFYLCQPPLPWVPLPERAEGYYLYVNKNVIEALALAILGLVPTGRWFGLDGLVHALFGRRANQAQPPAPTPSPASSTAG